MQYYKKDVFVLLFDLISGINDVVHRFVIITSLYYLL